MERGCWWLHLRFVRASGRRPINLIFRKRGQLLVRSFFFGQIQLQDLGAIRAAERPGPGDQRPVASHLVMFDRLRGSDKRRVQHLLLRDLAADFISFFEDAVDRGTIDLSRLCAMHLEHLLDALDVILGLPEMSLKSGNDKMARLQFREIGRCRRGR